MARALSLLQPFAWLVANGLKDVENRNWSTKFRGRFLVHAGKAWGKAQKDSIARIKSAFPDIQVPEQFDRGGIVGEAQMVDCVKEHPSPWFVGRYGFLVADARPFEFRAYPGSLGWFDAPDFHRRKEES